MNIRIAITGLPGSNKTLLAAALSNMTGISYIRNKTMYEWRRMFNIPDSGNLEWKDMFVIAVSSFFKRANTESCFDQFISDGASFSEWAWLKMHCAEQDENLFQRGRSKIIESLERLTASYAAQQYDLIVHVNNPINNGSSDVYVQLYKKYGIPHKIYDAGTLEETLQRIIFDMNLPVINAVEGSIYKAKNDFFLNNKSNKYK